MEGVDTASTQPGELILPLAAARQSTGILTADPGLPLHTLRELWLAAEAEPCGLSEEEFGNVLASVGAKLNHGLPPGTLPSLAQKTAFFRSLHLPELALAHACALGREDAWQRFFELYRASLTQAAVAITGSATLGHDLAESLYAELYGLRQHDGQRQSPLASYSGRGSLLGWLRTTLAQRHMDHHRRTFRETPLGTLDAPAPDPQASPAPAELARLGDAVSSALKALAAEDRFLLAAYFLDRQTLLQIAHILRVHEATVSRRLKRLTADLRKQLLRNLRSVGLSARAAEEALGADPRDLEINLRALLQTSQSGPFSSKKEPASTTESGQP